MQRRFTRKFKRHVHIKKNLILQILFLFLNFAVFWLPAEIITLYTKNRLLKDTVQVTKSLNILLDPLIITGFDTRFSSAAKELLLRWRPDDYPYRSSRNRLNAPSNASIHLMTTRQNPIIRRLKHSKSKAITRRMSIQQSARTTNQNKSIDNDFPLLELASNHIPVLNEQQLKPITYVPMRRQPQRRKHQQRQKKKR